VANDIPAAGQGQSDSDAFVIALGLVGFMEVGKIIKETGFSSPQSSRNSRIPDYMSHQNDQLITPRILALFKQHGAGELTEEEFHSQLEQVKQNYSKSSGNLVNKSI